MSRRRRTPDLVATVTGAEPQEAAAPVEAPKRRKAAEDQAPPADRRTGRTPPARAGSSARANAARGGQKDAAPKDAGAKGNAPRWSTEPKRSNFTFRLSEEVSDELERLIMALRFEHGIRASRSEIAEVALQVAVEDAGKRGEKSDVVGRLSGKLRRRHDGDEAKSASK